MRSSIYVYLQIRVESCGQTLSSLIFRPSSMQVDIADRHNDCQLMYNKGKLLVFASNSENVFFLALGRHFIYMLLNKKNQRYWRNNSGYEKLFSPPQSVNTTHKDCFDEPNHVWYKNVKNVQVWNHLPKMLQVVILFFFVVLLLWIQTFSFWLMIAVRFGCFSKNRSKLRKNINKKE